MLTAAKKAIGRRDESAPGKDLLAEINRILTDPAGRSEAQAARRASAAPSAVPDPATELRLAPVPEEPEPEPDAAPAATAAPPASPRPRRHARRIDLLED